MMVLRGGRGDGNVGVDRCFTEDVCFSMWWVETVVLVLDVW